MSMFYGVAHAASSSSQLCSRMYMHTGAYVMLHSSTHDKDKRDARREEAGCSEPTMRDKQDDIMMSMNVIDASDMASHCRHSIAC